MDSPTHRFPACFSPIILRPWVKKVRPEKKPLEKTHKWDTRVKYCTHFCVAPALIACKRVQAHTNVERRHITRLTISGAEARRIVRYADARPQSFTLREEARSCLAALSQLLRRTLLPVIVEMHLVSGYYALKLYSFHVTHPRRKALPYVRKRDAAHTLREESP